MTDKDIGESRAKLESRLAELRLQSRPEVVAALQKTYNEATPKELSDWERLTGKLAGILEDHANTLLRLKDLRKTNGDRAVEMNSWQGFAEKPPYSISFLDGLRDALVAKQITLQSLEVMRTTAEGELEEFSSGLRKSRKQVRLAEEDAEMSKGKPGETRKRWLLIMARLHDEVNQAGTVYAEARRVQLQEAVEGAQAEIGFLEKKLAVAKGMYRFSEEELKQKLLAMESRREQLGRELEQAVRLEEKARLALDAGEAEVRAAKAGLSGASKGRLGSFLKVYQVRQVLFEAADSRVQILKGMLLLLKHEARVWNERYLLAARHGEEENRPDLKEYQQDLDLIGKWKGYVVSRLASLQVLIRSEQDKLSPAALPESDRESARSILAAYQEQETLLRRGNEILIEYDQLVQRRNEEAKTYTAPVSLEGRARGALATVSSLALRIRDSELYVAEETTIVDGNKIIRPRSVTVGKLAEAFLILLVGLWVIRHLKKLFHWIATKRRGFRSLADLFDAFFDSCHQLI